MPLTYFFAQIFGLFCLVMGASILLQRKVFIEVVHDLAANRALLYILGLISLFLGLFVVLLHDIWNGGFLPALISLIGWLMILRGIFALTISHENMVSLVKVLKVRELFWLYGLIILLLGAYLTYAGFAL